MPLRSDNNKSSLRRFRGLIIGTAITIGTILAANAIVLAQLHQSTLREVQSNLLRQSLALSTVVERTFQSTDLVLASVAEKVRLAAAADGDLHQLTNVDYYVFLKEKMSGLPQIDALGIVDAEGKRLNLSREWPSPNTDLSYREYFRAIKENPKITSFVSQPVQASANGTWVVILARPVLAADGKLLGLVFASARMKYFEELFHSTSLGEGYAAALMRQDGTLLARYPVAGTIGKRAPASVLTKLVASRSGVSRSISPFDHQARIVAGYRLVNYPLVVVATQNEEAAFAPWRTTAVTTDLIASIMIVLIIIAACLIARSWKQQERLNRASADVIESDKTRALAEAELNRQQDLAEQNMRFNAAVQNMSQGLCMFDKETRLVVCNELFAKMYRLPAELLKPGTLRSDIIEHVVRNGILKGSHGDVAVQQRLSALPKLPTDEKSSHINEHADGKLICVTHQPMEGGGWVATHEDITEQRRAEQELGETKRFLDSIIANIPIAVIVKDANTRKFILANRAFATMLDLSQNDLLGKTVFDIYGSKAAELLDSADSETLRSSNDVEYSECDVEMPTRGMRIHATSRIVIRNDQGDAKYLVAVIDDVTERKKSEQRIAFMAHHDALTGLANRAAVAQKIEDAAARHRRWGDPFTVLLMDLDRFKNVNDTLGHSAGDALLQEAAMRLKTFMRETDVLARLGGDEFAIIQGGETNQREAASTLADRIIELIAKPFNIDGNEVNIGTRHEYRHCVGAGTRHQSR